MSYPPWLACLTPFFFWGGGFGTSIFGLSATGVGLVLVVIGIAIALLIEFFKTNELQDWLGRSLLGTMEADKRYANLEQEIVEFGLAIKSLGYRREDEANSTTALPAH